MSISHGGMAGHRQHPARHGGKRFEISYFLPAVYGKSFWEIVGVHFWIPQTCLFERLEDERIPGKDTMVAVERVGRIGGEVFLAGRKVRANIDFRPKPVGDGLGRAAPSVKLSGNVSADFNPHPTAAVVVDSVHAVIGVA